MKKMLKLTELNKREMGRIIGGKGQGGSCSCFCSCGCAGNENVHNNFQVNERSNDEDIFKPMNYV